MNLLTYIMHLAGSGASAYFGALQIRDIKTPEIGGRMVAPYF